ncbi:glyoxalase superfamily protein [Oricola sp.]|uniref:glyoxalase superfamily protein n=1 Tax=Oricola sp. TaxID=1979950 RepID=UPI0025D70049|nr:glyoxalase superfamily protein [Oricola sp.]MCI5078467.1 glyoxalase superfamily protein [Oricola sp.]
MTDSTVSPLRFGRMAPTLAVTDMQVARDFYIDVLGFEIRFENGDPVGFMIVKRDAAELHLTLQRAFKPASFNVAHLLVEGVDELHARIAAHGCRILKGIRDKEFGLRAFVFEDPFGNRIDVGEPL